MPNLFSNPIHSSIRVHFKNSHHLKSVQGTITGVHPPLTLWGCGRFLCLAELCTHSYFLPWFIKINEISRPGSYQPSQPAISCSNYNNPYIVNIAQPVCVVILKCGHKIYLSSPQSWEPLSPGLVSVLVLYEELRSADNFSMWDSYSFGTKNYWLTKPRRQDFPTLCLRSVLTLNTWCNWPQNSKFSGTQ